MIVRSSHCPWIFAAALAACVAPVVKAQAPEKGVSPAAAFREARSLYYTPADKGLQGFTCDLAFDWKSFIQKATDAPVEDTSSRLAYLRSIKLSVTDDLQASGELQWTAPAVPPDADEASIGKIRGGLEQMWAGFFQSWNGLYDADVITLVDATTTVDRTPTGYHVFSREGGNVAEETFTPDFTLQSLHVSTPAMDTTLTPRFEKTAQGRLITNWTTVTKQPPTAPGTTVTTAVHYAPVNGFQIPSEVHVDIAGLASFEFHLSGCTVSLKAPAK